MYEAWFGMRYLETFSVNNPPPIGAPELSWPCRITQVCEPDRVNYVLKAEDASIGSIPLSHRDYPNS